MELLLATLVIPLAGAVLGLGVLVLTTQKALVAALSDDKDYARQRIADLERSLASHSFEQYAALSQLPTPLERSRSTVSFGGTRPDEAWGEAEEDIIESYLAANGVDLEGPTIG